MSQTTGSVGDRVLPLVEARSVANERGTTIRLVGRTDPRDVFMVADGEASSFAALRDGARVVVTERRCEVLLLAFEPRAECLRSDSVQGALERLDEGAADAAILPALKVVEAGREGDIAEWLHQTSWIPKPARGFMAALEPSDAVEANAGLHAALKAEEAVAALLGEVGDRTAAAVGAIAIPFGDYLRLWALAVSADGRRAVRVHRTGRQDGAAELGERVVDELLARGGRTILQEAG